MYIFFLHCISILYHQSFDRCINPYHRYQYTPIMQPRLGVITEQLNYASMKESTCLLFRKAPFDSVQGFAVVTLTTQVHFNRSRVQGVCCHLREHVQCLLHETERERMGSERLPDMFLKKKKKHKSRGIEYSEE